MFRGNLEQMNLADVVKLLVSSGQSGLLHLRGQSADQSGGCYFHLGKFVHANLGGCVGLDAISRMCRMLDGTFAFEEAVVAPDQTLTLYPTEALVDLIQEQLQEAETVRRATPSLDDVPTYLPGRKLESLNASADELSILLLCNGSRTVREVAVSADLNLQLVCFSLAKFCMAGVVEIAVGEASQNLPPSSVDNNESTGSVDIVEESPRFWRGRRIS